MIQTIEKKYRGTVTHGIQSYVDPCPKCKKGWLHFYWSQFAGVEWAKCTTKNCFNYKKGKLVLRKKPKLKLRKRKQLTLI